MIGGVETKRCHEHANLSVLGVVGHLEFETQCVGDTVLEEARAASFDVRLICVGTEIRCRKGAHTCSIDARCEDEVQVVLHG